jgi:hypothetical protein
MVQEVGHAKLQALGITLVAADSPHSFDDTPTSRLVRQILASEFDRAMSPGRPRSEAGARRQVRGPQESCGASARGGRAGATAATASAEGREEITQGNLGRAGPMRSPQRARETVLGVGNPLDAEVQMIRAPAEGSGLDRGSPH